MKLTSKNTLLVAASMLLIGLVSTDAQAQT